MVVFSCLPFLSPAPLEVALSCISVFPLVSCSLLEKVSTAWAASFISPLVSSPRFSWVADGPFRGHLGSSLRPCAPSSAPSPLVVRGGAQLRRLV